MRVQFQLAGVSDRSQAARLRQQPDGLSVQGSGFRVLGSWSTVQAEGFRIWGLDSPSILKQNTVTRYISCVAPEERYGYTDQPAAKRSDPWRLWLPGT